MAVNLEGYLKSGMENILRGAINVLRLDMQQRLFMSGFARSVKKASARRDSYKR